VIRAMLTVKKKNEVKRNSSTCIKCRHKLLHCPLEFEGVTFCVFQFWVRKIMVELMLKVHDLCTK